MAVSAASDFHRIMQSDHMLIRIDERAWNIAEASERLSVRQFRLENSTREGLIECLVYLFCLVTERDASWGHCCTC